MEIGHFTWLRTTGIVVENIYLVATALGLGVVAVGVYLMISLKKP